MTDQKRSRRPRRHGRAGGDAALHLGEGRRRRQTAIPWDQTPRTVAPAASPSRMDSAMPWNIHRPYRPTAWMTRCCSSARIASPGHVEPGHDQVYADVDPGRIDHLGLVDEAPLLELADHGVGVALDVGGRGRRIAAGVRTLDVDAHAILAGRGWTPAGSRRRRFVEADAVEPGARVRHVYPVVVGARGTAPAAHVEHQHGRMRIGHRRRS